MGERLRSWVRSAPLGRGRWMTGVGGFLALQTFSLLVVAEVQGRTVDPDPALLVAGFLVALAGLALCGVGLPLMAHARRVRKWRQRFIVRLQHIKGWFVEGRITEADLDAARGALEEAIEGRFAGEGQRTAGDIQRRTGLLLLAWGLLAAVVSVPLDGPWSWGLGIGGVAAIAGAGVLLLRGWPEWKAGKARTAQHLARLDEDEADLLRRARASPPESRTSRPERR